MTFQSIIYQNTDDGVKLESVDMPDFFVDLNLDQVIDKITAQKNEYNLKPFFYSPLHNLDAIHFRQEIMRDLEDDFLLGVLNGFAAQMVLVRRYLNMISKLYFKYHQEGWHLEAAAEYCEAISTLSDNLSGIQLNSKGFLEFREYITAYNRSEEFLSLASEISSIKADLASIQYEIIIKDTLVKVRKYEGEIDYSTEVEKTFEKFKQGEVKNYKVKMINYSGMNHIEAQILNCVVRLHPEIFTKLNLFYTKRKQFMDEKIQEFDREIQFYISYIEFISNIKGKGLDFCMPMVTPTKNEIYANQAFDVALADKRQFEKTSIVCNDFQLEGPERVIVVSGPNQGGKTTFARMFGQLHFFASLGLPVPGNKAQLFLFDNIFTHFEKEEDIRNLRGKLKDDLVRIHNILDRASSESIIIMNEIFTSTALEDAIFLSKQIMDRIILLDCLGVCVSFIDELSTINQKIVSMVSSIVPNNPALRTFKITRKPADGLSYAICIAEKHRLTYDSIKERIAL